MQPEATAKVEPNSGLPPLKSSYRSGEFLLFLLLIVGFFALTFANKMPAEYGGPLSLLAAWIFGALRKSLKAQHTGLAHDLLDTLLTTLPEPAQREESAPAAPVSVFVTGPDGPQTLTVPGGTLTPAKHPHDSGFTEVWTLAFLAALMLAAIAFLAGCGTTHFRQRDDATIIVPPGISTTRKGTAATPGTTAEWHAMTSRESETSDCNAIATSNQSVPAPSAVPENFRSWLQPLYHEGHVILPLVTAADLAAPVYPRIVFRTGPAPADGPQIRLSKPEPVAGPVVVFTAAELAANPGAWLLE